MLDWWCLATQLGTPRGRYNEHSGKFPSVQNQGLIEPVGERNHFQRLLLAGLAMLQTICLWRLLIRLKRIYNFLCSMLVYTPFALCFVTLWGVVMHFPELTY
jgi:hypothetical protein